MAVFAFRGPVGMAVRPIAEKLEFPLLGGVGNKEFTENNEFTFQIWPPSTQEGAFLANQIYRSGSRRVAMITTEDDWPVAVSAGIRAAIEETSLELVFDQSLNPKETDIRTMLLRITRTNPDAIILNLGLPQIAPAIKQLHELHFNVPVYSNYFAGQSEVIEATSKEVIEGVMFVEMQTEFPAFPEGVPGATLSSYVATRLLAQAAQAVRESEAKSMYEALLRQETIDTAGGNCSVKNRIVQFPMLLRVIREGRVETRITTGEAAN